MKIRSVVLTGLAFGLAGTIGQIVLTRRDLPLSATFSGILSLLVPMALGVLIGVRSPDNPLSTAAVAGLIAVFPASLIQVGSLLVSSSQAGQSPFASIEAILTFVGTLIACTVLYSWALSGLAALVALGFAQSSQ